MADIKVENLPAQEEQDLYTALSGAAAIVTPSLESENFTAAMSSLRGVAGAIGCVFFDNVKVNDENADLRANRLALLSVIKTICEQVADFSQIEG